MAGTLYVVATPIGNLGDLTPRAAETLTHVAAVAAEDTRHTGALLRHLDSRAQLISVHAHAPASAHTRVLKLLAAGKDVALVSDAGTPAISDPGGALVAAARARGVSVVSVPGPSAVTAALAAAGLPADRFVFLGFLPRKGSERRRLLETIARNEWTTVIFESPLRTAALLADLARVCGGERPAAVARELTKRFEQTRGATLAELAGLYAETPPRGEVTIVIAGTGRAPAVATPPDPEGRARALLASGASRRDVAERLSAETGISRNAAYKLVNAL